MKIIEKMKFSVNKLFKRGKIIEHKDFIEVYLPCGYIAPLLPQDIYIAKYALYLDNQSPGAGKEFLEERKVKSLNSFICSKKINYSHPEMSLIYYDESDSKELSKSIEQEYQCEITII